MDTLETRPPAEREAALMAALPAQLAHARAASPALAAILAGIDPARITSRAGLAALPVTRKHELLERQQAGRAQNVFGGFSTIGFGAPCASSRAAYLQARTSGRGWKRRAAWQRQNRGC